jgi:nucleotide-binding universal stress UspA family protein
MNLFRRPSGPDVERAKALWPAVTMPAGVLPRRETGSVLVAVDGRPHRWDALEWAAAEAAARQCLLRIVHVISWAPLTWDAFGGVYANERDAGVYEDGQHVVNEAADLARAVAPDLRITTHMREGGTASALLREGSGDALIVIGRERTARRFSITESVSAQVARRSRSAVAIIELREESLCGPSAGRVVVGLDHARESSAVLAFACRAALRRGVGVTALHALAPTDRPGRRPAVDCCVEDTRSDFRDVAEAVRRCRGAFPGVEVRQRLVAGPAGPALIAESAGAALVVLGSGGRGRLWHALFGSTGRSVLQSARAPVVVVGTSRRP